MLAKPNETTAHETTTNEAKPNAEKRSASTRTRHATPGDLFVVQTYEPDFMLAVENARMADEAISLSLEGYGNKEVAIACLWYALDQGVAVLLTAPPAQESNTV